MKIAQEGRADAAWPIHAPTPASGRLVWGHKHHIGGTDLRDLGFDRPDYEVNSALVSPEKIWTSL
jgi:hypothetical protein